VVIVLWLEKSVASATIPMDLYSPFLAPLAELQSMYDRRQAANPHLSGAPGYSELQ